MGLCGDDVGGKHGVGLGVTAALLAISIWQAEAGSLSLGESKWQGGGVVDVLERLGDDSLLSSWMAKSGQKFNNRRMVFYPASKSFVRHVSDRFCDDICTRVELNDGWRFAAEPSLRRRGEPRAGISVIGTNLQRLRRVFGLPYGGGGTSAVPRFSGGSAAAVPLPLSRQSFVLPAEEMELNQQSHEAEIANSSFSADGSPSPSYYRGPVQMPKSKIRTFGYDVGNFSLPDFDIEFRKSCGYSNDLVRVTSDPLLSPQECDDIVSTAEAHFSGSKKTTEWSSLDSGRFQIAGSWIKDIPSLRDRFNELLRTKLFPALAQTFPDVVQDPSLLRVQSAYIFKYTPETGEKTDMHMDSSLLSFTILLNDPSEFSGGGTFYEALGDRGDILTMRKGDVTFRPAALRHRGQPITSGRRYVIGGFVTVAGRNGCEHTRQLLTRGTKSLTDQADTTKARSLFELARDNSPNFSESYVSLAHCLRKVGDDDGALQSYLEAHKTNPRNADAAFMVGVMYSEKGDDTKALKWYQLASRLNEYDGDAWYRQGLIMGRQGDAAKEREMYERAVAVQPHHADALCNLGVLHGEAGDTEREIAFYELALEAEPDNADALNNAKAAYYYRGVDAYRDGDLDLAEASFRRILEKIAPDEPTVMAVHNTVLEAKAKRDETKQAKNDDAKAKNKEEEETKPRT